MKKVLVAGAALMLAGSMVSAASAEVNLSGDARARYCIPPMLTAPGMKIRTDIVMSLIPVSGLKLMPKQKAAPS